MRHKAILVGDALCERAIIIGCGLGFESSCLIKGRGWQNYKVSNDFHSFEYIFYLDIYLSLTV